MRRSGYLSVYDRTMDMLLEVGNELTLAERYVTK